MGFVRFWSLGHHIVVKERLRDEKDAHGFGLLVVVMMYQYMYRLRTRNLTRIILERVISFLQ